MLTAEYKQLYNETDKPMTRKRKRGSKEKGLKV